MNANKLRLALSILMLLFAANTLWAQNNEEYEKYLQTARKCLAEGNCGGAERSYKVYKELTHKTDYSIEKMIKECVEPTQQQPIPPGPIISEPPVDEKPQSGNRTMGIEVIGGTNMGVAMDFSTSCFLYGFGAEWMVFAPERTTTSNLVDSGYIGNFTKTTTTSLGGADIFLDLGAYFKRFSVSCQVGLLWATVNRTSLYTGWGYGLVDGDVNEFWGNYSQRSFTNSTSDKELHLTLTPQVKGYIPVGRDKSTSISVGLGYTYIPTLNYFAGLSGSLGIHFEY